jgi:hypothetical protein
VRVSDAPPEWSEAAVNNHNLAVSAMEDARVAGLDENQQVEAFVQALKKAWVGQEPQQG